MSLWARAILIALLWSTYILATCANPLKIDAYYERNWMKSRITPVCDMGFVLRINRCRPEQRSCYCPVSCKSLFDIRFITTVYKGTGLIIAQNGATICRTYQLQTITTYSAWAATIFRTLVVLDIHTFCSFTPYPNLLKMYLNISSNLRSYVQ